MEFRVLGVLDLFKKNCDRGCTPLVPSSNKWEEMKVHYTKKRRQSK